MKDKSKAEKYQLIIADAVQESRLASFRTRERRLFVNYLCKYGENVEIAIMDMSKSFTAAVKEALGKPVIVAAGTYIGL